MDGEGRVSALGSRLLPDPKPSPIAWGDPAREKCAGTRSLARGLTCGPFPERPGRPRCPPPVSLALPRRSRLEPLPVPPPGTGPGRLPGRSGRWLPMLCAASCGSLSSAMSVYPQRRLGQGGTRAARGEFAPRRRSRAPGPQRPLPAPGAHTRGGKWCGRPQGGRAAGAESCLCHSLLPVRRSPGSAVAWFSSVA